MAKTLKHAAVKTVIAAHKHSAKTRTAFEAVSAVFVAFETHFLIFAGLLVLWAVYDVLDILEVSGA